MVEISPFKDIVNVSLNSHRPQFIMNQNHKSSLKCSSPMANSKLLSYASAALAVTFSLCFPGLGERKPQNLNQQQSEILQL